ncbi:MAG: hypothetical protein ABJQ71_11510 [Roseibium sp.]
MPLVVQEAGRIGMEPEDLLTIMSYETGGSLDPWQKGPTTKWGQHRGLIQFGEPQAKRYGYTPRASLADLVKASADYFVGSGWKPGMPFVNTYATVNAGSPGRVHASDSHVGGAPGSVLDKTRSANMAGHRAKAQNYLAICRDEAARRLHPDTYTKHSSGTERVWRQ